MIGVDRYDAYGTVAIAEKNGMDHQVLRQGTGLAKGIKMVQEQMIDHNIIHNGDPLARWCIQNAEVRNNSAEGWVYLVKPTKQSSTKIIDPAAAAVMAADRIIYLKELLAEKKAEYAAAKKKGKENEVVEEQEKELDPYDIIWEELAEYDPWEVGINA